MQSTNVMETEEFYDVPVAEKSIDVQTRFIRKTYAHLILAILSFIGLEILIFKMGWARPLALKMLSVNWLFVLGGFILASWFASSVAHQARSMWVQYAALILFTVVEAIIFVPMLFIANYYAPHTIEISAYVSLTGFIGLSIVAFSSKQNFSFLRNFLLWGFLLAILFIVAGAMFQFNTGLYFSIAMVGLAGAAVLYTTSKLTYEYPEDRYVAAALELFSSIALMFWYVLQIFLISKD